jgi:rhodanese-related sulfurtransferase
MNITKSICIVLGISLLTSLNSCTWWGHKKEAVKFVLVNVLDKKYFDDCRIVDDNEVLSVNVPMEELESYALDPQHGWDKEMTQIVLYCGNYKCTASGESARMLLDLGFKHVWAYEGGTAEWKQRGFPVEGPCQSSFLNDYQIPEGYAPHTGIPVISADELKKKIEKFASQ